MVLKQKLFEAAEKNPEWGQEPPVIDRWHVNYVRSARINF